MDAESNISGSPADTPLSSNDGDASKENSQAPSPPSWRERTRVWRWGIVTLILSAPFLDMFLGDYVPGLSTLVREISLWFASFEVEIPPLMLGLFVADSSSLVLAWFGALAVCIWFTTYLLITARTSIPPSRVQAWWSFIWRAGVVIAAGTATVFIGFAGLLVVAFSSSYARLTPVSEHGCELWTSSDPYFDDWYTGDIYVRQPWSLTLHHIDDWQIVDTSEGLEDEMHLHWEAETATLYVGLSEHRTPTNSATTFKRITVRCDTLEHRSEFLNEERARG